MRYYKPSGYKRTVGKWRNPAAKANCDRGVSAENAVIRKYKRNGWKVEREGKAHKGYDFVATKNGSKRFVEAKSGKDSALRKTQKKAKRRHGKKYHVHTIHRKNGKWDTSSVRL